MKPGARSFQLWKSCQRKRAYPTKELAYQKGQQVYRCRHCGHWHRSGALAKLNAQLKR
ncbi:MAG: hypothetical protein KGL39_15725 [Patescibacteria group bacterium]|nr:hypothetical protein [Patescibacteria group bacterium]